MPEKTGLEPDKETVEKQYGKYIVTVYYNEGEVEQIHVEHSSFFDKLKDGINPKKELKYTNIHDEHLEVLKKAAKDGIIPELT
jgi:hypothetical protein